MFLKKSKPTVSKMAGEGFHFLRFFGMWDVLSQALEFQPTTCQVQQQLSNIFQPKFVRTNVRCQPLASSDESAHLTPPQLGFEANFRMAHTNWMSTTKVCKAKKDQKGSKTTKTY